MDKKWDNPITKELFKAVLELKSVDETKRFFRDLLTEEEIIEFAKRWRAAQLLAKEVSYSQIERETGLSSTTVARVSRWLNRGTGGYKLVLQRLSSHHHNSFPDGKGLR